MDIKKEEPRLTDMNSIILMLSQLSGRLDEIISILSRVEHNGVKVRNDQILSNGAQVG